MILSPEEHNAWRLMEARDYAEAARLFEPLAERGSVWAHVKLGWLHEHGHIGAPDLDKAIAAYEKSAVPGNPEGMYYLGQALLKKGDRARAQKVFREGSAELHLGCTRELLDLEEQLAWEMLEARKYAEAAQLFDALAARGSVYALINLGWMYNRGHLGAPDPKKAIALWEQAARAGSVEAQHRIARALLRSGDRARALALFLECAERGYKPSIYWAGRALVRRQAGPADRDQGLALLERAVERGHALARIEILLLAFKEAPTFFGRLRAGIRIVKGGYDHACRAAREPGDVRHSDNFR
ncbi:MAG: sel1 repeat family protein [Alphaproteobacteria bacterium]|nr:sel1 repeat family protein [Alphaproteobacteria bacterium]